MKTVANIVVAVWILVTASLALWLVYIASAEGPIEVSYSALVATSLLCLLLSIAVAYIMGYSWLYQRPYRVTWNHIGHGVIAVGTGFASCWLFLASGFGVASGYLIAIGLIFWGLGVLCLFGWMFNPAPQRLRSQNIPT